MVRVITLTFVSGIVDAGAPAEALALQVLADALCTLEHHSSQAWQLAQPSTDSPMTFTFTMLSGRSITDHQQWELVQALLQHPKVRHVWPSLVA